MTTADRYDPWAGGAWPRAKVNARLDDPDEVGELLELARYTRQGALDNTRLAYSHDTAAGSAAERFRAILNRVAAVGLRYAQQPFGPLDGWQAIRDPWWVFGTGVGTCIDLALIITSAAFDRGLHPVLLVLDEPGGARHAIPGVVNDPLGAPHWYVPASSDQLSGWAQVAGLVCADAVALCTNVEGDPTQQGADRINNAVQVAVIDLAGAQKDGKDPYPARTKDSPREAISALLPAGPPFIEYPSRQHVLDGLTGRRGLVVLHGERGAGKSLLAREIALTAQHGAGWMLRGDDAPTLDLSLAAAELWEHPASRDQLRDSQQVAVLAERARRRLNDSPVGWVVIVDNADTDPGPLLKKLPVPGPDDLVVVTTTNPDWKEAVGDTEFKTVGSLDHNLDAEAYGASTPLLASALSRLDKTGVAVGAATVDAVVGAALAALEEIQEACETALTVALSPPTGVSERHVDKELYDTLVAHGIVEWYGRTLWMHGLFREAVRERLADQHPDVLCGLLLLDDTVGASVQVRADLDWIASKVIDLELAGTIDPIAAGKRLTEVGTAIETLGDTTGAGELFAQALELLDVKRTGDGLDRWRAAALHGTARPIWQKSGKADQDLNRARELAAAAVTARERALKDAEMADRDDREVEYEASRALLLLIDGALADKIKNRHEAIEALETVIDGLIESEEARNRLLGDDHFMVWRARFNPAGRWNNLAVLHAKRDGGITDPKLFDHAIERYDKVGTYRDKMYGVPHLHTASCISGRAIATYNKAVYADVGGQTERRALLLDALRVAVDALTMRREAGGNGHRDVAKSVDLIYKITTSLTALDGIPFELDGFRFEEIPVLLRNATATGDG
jgi:tetratricopeptide (TPR) repeat protein